jgi:hypothetical protein
MGLWNKVFGNDSSLVGMAEREGVKGLDRLKRERDHLRSKYPEHVWQMIEKRAQNEIANRTFNKDWHEELDRAPALEKDIIALWRLAVIYSEYEIEQKVKREELVIQGGKFLVHVLDPVRGYYTKELMPKDRSDARKLIEHYAHGNEIFQLSYFENGERIDQFVPKEDLNKWLKLKRNKY